LYKFMKNLALAGSPNHDGTPSFGSSEDEVYKAISDKIAAAAYHFFYTTSAPVAGATTQDPTSLIVTPSNYLYTTRVGYPSGKGNLLAFDTTSFIDPQWNAIFQSTHGYPANWTKRRIYYQKNNSNVVAKVIIADDGAISDTSAADLKDAGLGASTAEAKTIMQWLLGKPELGNPAPLMGSITSSTPIVVGQPAPNGLNGSAQYSASHWTRPQLVYVGGDDGMLHAFFAHLGPKN
jgi:hypothetical protein